MLDNKLVKIAIRGFYGVGPVIAERIMARLQFHEQLLVRELSERQLNALSALLSAPSAHPRPSTPLRPFSAVSPPPADKLIPRDPPAPEKDPLVNLMIEEDLLRKYRADIAHLYNIGTWRGLRHAMRLPVRGQKSHPNGKTAKRLNRLDRRAYSTVANAGQAGSGRVMESLRTLHASTGRPSLSSLFR
ncbi:hypothetical protein NBRC10513v2_001029 [Rhodotorula toruloides]